MARNDKIPLAGYVTGTKLGEHLRGGVKWPVLKPQPTPKQMIAPPPGKKVRVRVKKTGAQGYKATG